MSTPDPHDQPYATLDAIGEQETRIALELRDDWESRLGRYEDPALQEMLHEVLYELALDVQRAIVVYLAQRLGRNAKARFEGFLITEQDGEVHLRPMFRSGTRRLGVSLKGVARNFFLTSPDFPKVLARILTEYMQTIEKNMERPIEEVTPIVHAMTYRHILKYVQQGNSSLDELARDMTKSLKEGLKPRGPGAQA